MSKASDLFDLRGAAKLVGAIERTHTSRPAIVTRKTAKLLWRRLNRRVHLQIASRQLNLTKKSFAWKEYHDRTRLE